MTYALPVPKLWLDKQSDSYVFKRQQQCEGACPPVVDSTDKLSDSYVFKRQQQCDGACPPVTSSTDKLISLKKHVRQVQSGITLNLSLNRDAFVCRAENYWAVIGSQGDRVVVLDEEAGQLLRSLPEARVNLRRQFSDWPVGAFEQVVALLLALGVLSSPQVSSHSMTWQPLDTIVAWLHLTETCNLNCAYCYVPRRPTYMTVSTARRAVGAVYRSAIAHGYSRVRLKYAGGEPTLNWSAMWEAQVQAEALSEQTGIGLETVLLTNGVHIPDEEIDNLLAHNLRVTVSLDGVGACQDEQRPLLNRAGSSFARVAHTLDQLQEWGILPHISITLTRPSLRGLPELIAYLLDRGLYFSFNFYRPPRGKSIHDPLMFQPGEAIEGLYQTFDVIREHLPQASLLAVLADRADLSVPHQRTCGVGQNYLVIGCDGEVSKCHMDLHQPITTIDTPDPLTAVQSDRLGIQNLSVEEKACRDCPWRYYCTGGCPRLAYQFSGRYDQRSPLCEVYKAILPEIVKLEALRLVRYTEPWPLQ